MSAIFLCFLFLTLVSFTAETLSAQTLHVLWPEGAPGAIGQNESDQPSLIAFPTSKLSASHTAVIVCPGGAYGMLSMEKEGVDVAHWLNDLGISAFVLRYRLGPVYHHPIEMKDGQRAIRWVRAHANNFSIEANHVGMIGFSAGGHLTATLATHFDSGNPLSTDSIERMSSRPDFQILIYPVISMDQAFTHRASRINLLGTMPDPVLLSFLSAEKNVTSSSPPAFIVHAKTDPIVSFLNSQAYSQALNQAGVKVEFRAFNHGGHGFGLAPLPSNDAPELSIWPTVCALWLINQGFLKKTQ